jgi:hypothetical protein
MFMMANNFEGTVLSATYTLNRARMSLAGL